MEQDKDREPADSKDPLVSPVACSRPPEHPAFQRLRPLLARPDKATHGRDSVSTHDLR